MTSVFDPSIAIDAVDAILGDAAEYRSPIPGSAWLPFVLFSETGAAIGMSGTMRPAFHPGVFEASKASLPNPVKDGYIRRLGKVWQIKGDPVTEDGLERVWTLDCVRTKAP